MRNISFNYLDKPSVFKSTSLPINKGEYIAFTGASGAGKTTLVDLICGFYEPSERDILIDGISVSLMLKVLGINYLDMSHK